MVQPCGYHFDMNSDGNAFVIGAFTSSVQVALDVFESDESNHLVVIPRTAGCA